MTAWSVVGFLATALGWCILIYALWRNQRAAKGSDLVDDTNFGPRVASIVEVTLHPDHAAEWWKLAPADWAPTDEMLPGVDYWVIVLEWLADFEGNTTEPSLAYIIPVFPHLGMDSSEQHGHRPNDRVSS